jgi:hypothetical protein
MVRALSQAQLILLFPSLLAIPLARQGCLDATLLARFEVVGVTLDFLDDVLLLNLPLKPAQRVLERFAFLYTNFSQKNPTSKPARGLMLSIILEIEILVMYFNCCERSSNGLTST